MVGRAIGLGNVQCLGVVLIWMIVGQMPIVLTVGAGGVVWITLGTTNRPIYNLMWQAVGHRYFYVL